MEQDRAQTTFRMLIGIVILLMVANMGLFFRMNQLQGEVLKALEPIKSFLPPQPIENGSRPPNFSLISTDGNEVSLQDFQGHRLLLIFSSVSCPVCAEIWPQLNSLDAGDSSIQFLMISKGSMEENTELKMDHEFTFPVLNWDDTVANEYQVPGTPFAYLIDEDGVIAGSGFAGTKEDIRAILDSAVETTRGN